MAPELSSRLQWLIFVSMSSLSPLFLNCVDTDPYSAYGSGSTKLLYTVILYIGFTCPVVRSASLLVIEQRKERGEVFNRWLADDWRCKMCVCLKKHTQKQIAFSFWIFPVSLLLLMTQVLNNCYR